MIRTIEDQVTKSIRDLGADPDDLTTADTDTLIVVGNELVSFLAEGEPTAPEKNTVSYHLHRIQLVIEKRLRDGEE